VPTLVRRAVDGLPGNENLGLRNAGTYYFITGMQAVNVRNRFGIRLGHDVGYLFLHCGVACGYFEVWRLRAVNVGNPV
jgi:hypothetical protein